MVKEDFLHFIWKHKLFSSPQLTTTQGLPVRIRYGGIHNTNAGPDFLEARLQIGRREWMGHVEIHVRASDWILHKHQHDPAYENVILHAVYDPDKEIYIHNPGDLPVLDLSRYVDYTYIYRYRDLSETLREVACSARVSGVRSVTWNMWLERLAVERLGRKSEEIMEIVQSNEGDWHESIYQLVAQSFGFKVNQYGFQFLAESLPLRQLSAHRESHFQLEAMLFGQSGILNGEMKDDYPRALWEEYSYLKRKLGLSPVSVSVWKKLRLRPRNFPVVRISQLAHFLFMSEFEFVHWVEKDPSKMISCLSEIRAHPYWQDHSHFDQPCKRHSVGLGRSSVEMVVINAVAPASFSIRKYLGVEDYYGAALDLLEKLPAENNKIVRYWQSCNTQVENALQSQAALELRNEYCANKKCLNCMIGVELLRN